MTFSPGSSHEPRLKGYLAGIWGGRMQIFSHSPQINELLAEPPTTRRRRRSPAPLPRHAVERAVRRARASLAVLDLLLRAHAVLVVHPRIARRRPPPPPAPSPSSGTPWWYSAPSLRPPPPRVRLLDLPATRATVVAWTSSATRASSSTPQVFFSFRLF